jgi:hypothetical protein
MSKTFVPKINFGVFPKTYVKRYVTQKKNSLLLESKAFYNRERVDLSNTSLFSSVASRTPLLAQEDENTMGGGKKGPLLYTKIIILRNFSN